MSEVHVRLFGPPSLERAGRRVEVDTRKALALLAYLALVDRPVSRASLAALFWPNYDQKRSAANLRRTLWSLNHALGAGLVDAGNDIVALAAGPGLWIDVVEFRDLLLRTRRHGHPAAEPCAECHRLLAVAADLARGDFLEGFTLHDAVEFDDWQSLTTAGLRNSLADCLRRLVAAHTAAGDLGAAKGAALRWAQMDSLDQTAAEQLMLLHAWTGEHAAALHVYRHLERALQAEFGAAPDSALTALFAAIKERREPPPPISETPLPATVAPPAVETAIAPVPLSVLPPFLAEEAAAVAPPLFVARERELALFDAHLHSALNGQGRMIFVAGETGQGKTALLNAYVRHAAAVHPAVVAAGGACNAYTGIGDPYLPFRELLGMLTGDLEARLAAGSLPHEAALRLWNLMPAAVKALMEAGPDLLETFIPLRPLLARSASWVDDQTREALEDRRARGVQFDPMLQQASLFEQFTAVLRRLANHAPLLLTLDDLQWGDAGSLALLFHLSRYLAGQRILIVAAYRPDDVALGRSGERHPLEPLVHEVQRLQGGSIIDLAQAQERTFVDALLDSEPNHLGPEFREELFRQTGGHPLFTTELLRGMQERGDLVRDATGCWVALPALDWERLPVRVEAVIGERLGRLPAPARELLRAASVQGEEFSAEVAAHLLGMDEAEARRSLSGDLAREHRLVRGLGVQRIGDTRLTRYRFHHYLIQRSLYAGLDAAERAGYNEDAGLFLEQVYAPQTEEVAVSLARHFDAAGLHEKAIVYYQQAGDRALRLSANMEAANHYGRALALLAELPVTPERLQQELVLQAWYSIPIQHLQGWASPRSEAAFARALELVRLFGSPPPTHPLLGRIAHTWVYHGEHRRALALAQELLVLASAEEDDAVLLEAHTVVGLTHFYLGEFTAAQPHIELALRLYDRSQHSALTYLYGQDAGVHVGLYQMLNLTLLGYVEEGRAQIDATIALAGEIGHPFTLAFAWSFVAVAKALALDIAGVEQAAAQALAVAQAHAFPTWTAVGLLMRGYARGMKGDPVGGFEDAIRGLETAIPTGAQALLPLFLGLTAELRSALGNPGEALSILDIALTVAEENDERLSIADLHRRRGLLLLQLGQPWAEADGELRQAITIAHGQQARLHELRALTDLLRLAHTYAPGEAAAAHAALRRACAWFPAGLDAADLLAARRELANN